MSSLLGQEDKIMHLRERVSAVEQEFKDFTYMVSHDIGTPLRAVVNFSQLLEDKYAAVFDEKGRRYLEFITEGGKKTQAMLSGLLQYSRLSTQIKAPTRIETVTLVDQCHITLKEKIIACKGNIHVHGMLPEITADTSQCLQLFLVLIDNALTYHVPHVAPEIEISAADEGDAWKFSITDNGIGIFAANIEQVFQVFKRLHTDAEYPGVGMGLAIAKKIVELNGGTIGITSGKNGGTICWFTLPKEPPEAATTLLPQEALYG